jgi:hypothetical protein
VVLSSEEAVMRGKNSLSLLILVGMLACACDQLGRKGDAADAAAPAAPAASTTATATIAAASTAAAASTPPPPAATGAPGATPTAGTKGDAACESIGGAWRIGGACGPDNCNITQTGCTTAFKCSNGNVSYAGTVAGRNVSYAGVTATGQKGTCSGVLAADGKTIAGTCQAGAPPCAFVATKK